MSFKNKKGSESESKTFVCPHGYFRNYSSNFGKKNSDLEPRRKYFISYSPHIQGIHKRMVRFQKLIRKLFLTLHGHNVQRQQRQLSKFLMRYQQFASHA